MFTIEQINDIHERLGTMKDFLKYVKALEQIGVASYHSYVADGHSEYFGTNGYCVRSRPVHEELIIADTGNKETFLKYLSLHAQKKANYIEMSRGLAESGIEKWVVDTIAVTISYCDKKGNVLLSEKIE